MAERFINDLKASIIHVKDNPDEEGDMAPIYGMAATLPDKEIVEEFLNLYLDVYYETKRESDNEKE